MPENINVNPDYEECRLYGHAWNTESVGFSSKSIEEGLVCTRCSTERINQLQRRTGIITNSRYKYPKGYLMPTGEKFGREERGQLRVRHLQGKA